MLQRPQKIEILLKPIDKDFEDMESLDRINMDAFPEIERIPTEELDEKMRRYGCRSYGLYDGDLLIGFISIMHDPQLQLSFLWFLAIAPELRGKGYGTAALNKLKELFPGQIVLDMERIYPEAENYQQRLDRTRFYERNGLSRAHVGIKYLDMDLELMCTNPPLRQADFEDMVNRLPKDKFHPYLYSLNQE